MAKEIGGVYGVTPRIHPNWDMRGSSSRAKWAKKEEPYVSRKEFIELMEKNFPKAYLQEMGDHLQADERGIVVFQAALMPYDRDIAINPALKSHCSYCVKEMDKVLKMPYAFESRTYWLEKGKITPLLTPETVLEDNAAEKAVVFLLDKHGWHGVINKGVYNVSCGVHQRPCRVYEAEGNLILLNLTNGVINIVTAKDISLEIIEDPMKFYCGGIKFRREKYGYVKS